MPTVHCPLREAARQAPCNVTHDTAAYPTSRNLPVCALRHRARPRLRSRLATSPRSTGFYVICHLGFWGLELTTLSTAN